MRFTIRPLIASLLLFVATTGTRAAAPACTNTQTSLVSVSTNGGVGNADSSLQDINEDGRYIAFRSHATDIVPYQVNRPLGTNIYIRDRSNNSVKVLDDTAPGAGFNDQAGVFFISGDGRWVAFDTLANNVVPGVTDSNNRTDVYLKDLRTGGFLRATVPDSSITATTQSLHNASNFSVSRNGQNVAFVSSGLVFSPEYYAYPEPTNVFWFHVYVRDTIANRTYMVTRGVNAQGQPAPLNGSVGRPVLAASGQLLAFTTDSTNLRGFPNAGGRRDVYIASNVGGVWDVREKIVAPSVGVDYARRDDLSISPDGRYVAFIAQVNGAGELFVWDRQTSTMIQPRSTGTRPAGSTAVAPHLGNSTIAWQDYDLTGEGYGGAFWYHIPTGVLQRIGRETTGTPACCGSNGNGGEAGGVALSADGRWATYHSASPRIVQPDGNGTYDTFVQRMTAVADFSFTCTSLTCTFDATPTLSACAVATNAWTFGDGSNGSGVTTSHTYASGGPKQVTLTVTDVNGAQSSITKVVTPSADPPAAPTGYVAVAPCRIWDSRTPPNQKIASGQELILSITNPANGCAPNPNARAASINVTAVAPDNQGHVAAYAPGQPTATAALNFTPTNTPRANNMIVPVAANGTIALKPFVITGGVHLVVDINGYFTDSPGVGVQTLGFQSLTPCRVYDSRNNGGAPYASGEVRNLQVKGNCGVPTGAAAASLNAAVVGPTAVGHLILFPAGGSIPLVSNANFQVFPTGAVANGARVTLGAGSPDLGTQIVAPGGTAHLVVDANGYFKSDAPLQYTPLVPCRLLDTRDPLQGPAIQTAETRTMQVRGNCGVPSDAKAAMVNLTVVAPTATGHLIAFPSGIAAPLASTINFAANEPAQGNGAIVPLSQTLTNDLSLFAVLPPAGNSVNVIVDVFGYFR